MALEFYKRRFRLPSKKTQYVLAFAALLLVLAIVLCWMKIRHNAMEMQENSTSSSNDSSDISVPVYTEQDEGHLLVIVDSEETVRFIHLHSDPANNAIHVTTVEENFANEDILTLTPLYRKFGAAKVVGLLANKMNIPLKHYAAVTATNAERWFARFENGVTMTFDNPITVNAQEGEDPLNFDAGEHTLTAVQATALLTRADDGIGAEVIAAMLRQYMLENRHLTSDFSYLANIAQTSLRIGDFNDYHTSLTYLAQQNSLGNCTITARTTPKDPSMTRR